MDFRGSCAIPDPRNEFLYITGSGNPKQVSQYGLEGFIEDLPELNIGRNDHACAGYYDDTDHFILLVMGGVEGESDFIGKLK